MVFKTITPLSVLASEAHTLQRRAARSLYKDDTLICKGFHINKYIFICQNNIYIYIFVKYKHICIFTLARLH